jgi:hypothetical protein
MRALAVFLSAFAVSISLAQLTSMMDPGKATTMPLALLQQVNVQKELQMSGAQKSELKKIIDELNKQTSTRGASLGQLNTAFNEANQKAVGLLDEKQRLRFQEIRYQVLGMRSLGEPDVQTALALTEDQKAAVKEFEKEEMNGLMREAQKGPGAMGSWQKGKAKREAEIAKILSPDQAAKLQTLCGKPFKDANKIAGR